MVIKNLAVYLVYNIIDKVKADKKKKVKGN